MASDRTSLAVTTSFQRRPAVLNRAQRAASQAPQPAGRALQERLGNRATQALVAQSIGRQADGIATAAAGAKSGCGPGTCECASCKDQPKEQSPARGSGVDDSNVVSMFASGNAPAADTSLRPTISIEDSTGASAFSGVAAAPSESGAGAGAQSTVLPFPANNPVRQAEPGPATVQPRESMEKTVITQAAELSSETAFPSTRDGATEKSAGSSVRGDNDNQAQGPAPAAPARAPARARGQVVVTDTARSEGMVAASATAMHQRISGLFGGVRARFTAFFSQATMAVQQFVAAKQAEIAAAVAQTVQSIHAAVDRAAAAAEAAANNVRVTIGGIVQTAVGTLQTQVQIISNQIIGVINRFPGSSLPGVSQLRSLATSVLNRAASAVRAGLSRVSALINAALTAGMRVLQTIIGAARRIANAVVSSAADLVQRVLQMALQVIGRIATSVIAALQFLYSITILPLMNRMEGMIHSAISKALEQAVAALRRNRDEYLANLGSADDADDESDSELTEEALANNKDIVQTFQDRAGGLIGTIVQRISSAVAQIVAQVQQTLAQAKQFILGIVRQAIQTLRKIVQVVSNLIQSILRAAINGVTRVVGYVRTLINGPMDQLLRWGREKLNQMLDFVIRIGRNILNRITGSPTVPATGDFVPTPSLAPEPTFDPGPIPIPIPVPTPPTPVPGPVPVPVPVPVPTPAPPPILAIIIVVIILLILLILLIYLLYRWLRNRRRKKKPPKILHKTKQRKPGSRKRTIIGVGEEVFLEYTHGTTTWATTGGKLSKLVAAKVRLDAPDVAGTITVTAGTESVAFTVVAPTGVFMDRRGGMKHKVNRPNSGIRIRPYLMPDTVNFYRVVYHEMDIAFSTSGGAYACNPGAGGHCGKGGGGVPCDDLDVKNKVVAGRGTETVDDDCAFSGSCPGPATSPGSVFADIPHEYKVKGPTAGGFHSFPTVHQHHSLAADLLTLTTTKASASGTIKVTDPTSNNGCPPRL